jgi:hypothetical protein
VDYGASCGAAVEQDDFSADVQRGSWPAAVSGGWGVGSGAIGPALLPRRAGMARGTTPYVPHSTEPA